MEWRVHEIGDLNFSHSTNRRYGRFSNRKSSIVSSALVETAVSIAVAATVVGTAATLLAKRTKASEVTEVRCSFQSRICVGFHPDIIFPSMSEQLR